MCELCTGEFKQTLTIEVGEAALLRQRLNDFGPLHAIIEDCNVDDANIEAALRDDELSPVERDFCLRFLGMSCDDRVSALALAANMYGASPINGRLF
jgi:hypothetical protein